MVEEIAIFGGRPLFASPRPIGQLAAPDLGAYLQLLKRVVQGRRLSAHGRVCSELEERLAALHGARHCVAMANAGLALVALMRFLAQGRSGTVAMPSFSYRGLPHFAQWAAQMPVFCDVEETTHGLDPRALEGRLDERTTAILAVSNFNSACSIDELCAVADRHAIPIFFDSVYAAGATYRGTPLGSFGRAEVFSLHATKLLNGFEGGYATTDDDDLAAWLRRLRDGDAVNVRLNEVHAAMALASLAELDSVVARNRERYRRYRRVCQRVPGFRLLPYLNEDSERYNYQMAVVEVNDPWPLTRDETVKLLRAEGVAITAYYSPPLHRSAHSPPGSEVPDLPVSERLAERFMQLPVGELVSLEDIETLGAYLETVASRGAEIAQRLRSQA